jgi:hypothetical protein
VIAPAIRALEEKIAALGRSDIPGDAFAQADMEDVLKETKMAFGLSIQSIWERQLRGYLRGCAEELRRNRPMRPNRRQSTITNPRSDSRNFFEMVRQGGRESHLGLARLQMASR